MASFVCTWFYGGYDKVQKLFAACLKWQPLTLLLVALFSPILLEIAAALIAVGKDGYILDGQSLFAPRDNPKMGFVPFFLYNLLFFGYGEEVGWRGFALPHLQKSMKPITAALVLTVMWALWHWPLFLYRPGYVNMDISGAAGWAVSLLTGSLLLSWLYNGSKGSLLICAIFHATIDIAFTASIPQSVVGYMGMLVTIWGVVIVFFLKKPARQT